MKLLQFILIAIFLLGGVASCKKWKGDENKEVTYSGGRVVLINSDTPVPNALVRFTKWANSCLTCPMSYVEVGTDMTDENGHFDIPSGTGATMVIAFGLDSIFNHESQAGDLDAYWLHGGEMKLQLTPPAWIKVSAVDVEPLNQEVSYVQGSPNTGGQIIWADISTPQIWKVSGNVHQSITYLFVMINGTLQNLTDYQIQPPSPFDTTEYVISY